MSPVVQAAGRLAAMNGTLSGQTRPTSSQLHPDGAWSWFSTPEGMVSGGKLWVGSTSSTGSPQVSCYDLTTHRLQAFNLNNALEVDDHDNPVVLALPSGKIFVGYSRHNDATGTRYRIQTVAGDINSFGPEAVIPGTAGVSYTNLVYLSSESKIYNFFRGGGAFNPAVVMSSDEGATWTAKTDFISSPANRPYNQYVDNGVDTIHIFASVGHPVEMAANTCHLYHCYYRAGNVYKSDGTLIRSWSAVLSGSPLTFSDLTLVYDATAGGNAWTWSIELDGTGKPVVSFERVPSETDIHYMYGRWTGSAWDVREVCAGEGNLGTASYAGGVVVDPMDTSVVYVSRQFGTLASGSWELERRRTGDGGTNWAITPLTRGSAGGTKNIRPISPRGRTAGAPEVVWLSGTYGGPVSYNMQLRAVPALQPSTLPDNLALNGLGSSADLPSFTGIAIQGEVLTATPGNWAGSPTSYAYQWNRNGTPISGATASTYTIQAADVGQALTVSVLASNAAGAGYEAATSPAVTVVTAATFTPAALGTRVWGWWRADDLSALADGAAVTSWPDRSGNSRTLTQTTPSFQAVYKTAIVNGQPVVRFDGTNDSVAVAQTPGNVDLSLFVIQKINNATNSGDPISTRSGGANVGWILRNAAGGASTAFTHIGVPSGTTTISRTGTLTNWNMTSIIRTGLNVVLGINGSDSSSTTFGGYPPAASDFRVGAEQINGSQCINGDIAEVVVVTSALSATAYGYMKTYFANRYGITIA